MCKKKNSDTYEFADRSLQLSFKQQFGHRLKSVVWNMSLNDNWLWITHLFAVFLHSDIFEFVTFCFRFA